MDINLTLIGQALTFGIFVWFTMKFVWPPIVKVMRERQQQIADGLAAAEKGSRDLEEAQMKAEGIISEAKANAAAIMDGANSRANATIEESKQFVWFEADPNDLLASFSELYDCKVQAIC